MEVQVQHSHVISKASTSSLSAPTFTAYSSSENLGDIAARVVGELSLSSSDPYDDDFYASLADHHHPNDVLQQKQDDQRDHVDQDDDHADDNDDEESDDESEFEFAVVSRDGEEYSSPISADEIFADGQIRPMFPLFNTDLVFGSHSQNDDVSEVRLPLRKLLTQERENSNSRVSVSVSVSSDDNLDRIPSGTYCVWTPKKKQDKAEPDRMIGKKSRSTGSSSKRFRIRDLLYRSNSDGKDTFVFLTPHGGEHKRRDKTTPSKKGGGDAKKKSYLPYRRDLVGLFTNVNGISRTVRPF